jgi:hypothetical protein
VAPDEHPVDAADHVRARERPLQPQAREVAEADRAVDPHRVGDAHARAQPLRIIVGHLVGGHVGRHLQGQDRDVARARARDGDAQRGRCGSGHGGHGDGRQPGATAHERHDDADGHHARCDRADGARLAHCGRQYRCAFRPFRWGYPAGARPPL